MKKGVIARILHQNTGSAFSFTLFKHTTIAVLVTCGLMIFVAFFTKDIMLISICSAIICTTLIGYFLVIKLKFYHGIHVHYLGIIAGCTFASFTHLIEYPLILIYPLVIVLAILSWINVLERGFYLCLGVFGCGINIYNSLDYFNTSFDVVTVFTAMILGFGFLGCLFFITNSSASTLTKYHTSLEQKQMTIVGKNNELEKYIASNIQLEQFASIVSHDLKTPLNTIKGFSKLLNSRLLNADIGKVEKESLRIIESSSNQMLDLIEDLSDFSKVNSQKLKVSMVDLELLIKNVIEVHKEISNEKNVTINILNEFPTLMVDRVKIKRVFQNLITNAIKFSDSTKEPKVDIFCKEKGDLWVFHVKDNGIGIKDRKIDVFGLYVRINATSDSEGTGMGLSLCKKIIEQHGGVIDYNSELGKGSDFYFGISKNLKTENTTHE